MTIALSQLHAAVEEYFLDRFQFPGGAPLQFRFDKFGSVVSDDDFVDPNFPDQGYSPALARERVSALVNHAPVDVGDGATVVLSETAIDSTYFYQMLAPSQPYLPAEASAEARKVTLETFARLKARGVELWEAVQLISVSGLPLDFRPTDPTPTAWYDEAADDVWTHVAFTLDAPPAADFTPNATQLPPVLEWRLSPPKHFITRLPKARELADAGVVLAPIDPPGADTSAAGLLLKHLQPLDLRSRLIVSSFVEARTPVQPVQAASASMAFDYCLVRLERSWYFSAFVNDDTWYVPNRQRGELTSASRSGGLAQLPVAFVAIRNLAIEGDWAGADALVAAQATAFGPFHISAAAAGGISHPGLQIVGWLLQTMPELPPNAPPSGTGSTDRDTEPPTDPAVPPREHVVKKGQTLWAIAKSYYGDPTRWPELKVINGLASERDLKVGQRLRIP